MDKSEQVELISLGFSVINMILQYFKQAGVSEEVIDANWAMIKMNYQSRSSDDLGEVPE